MIKKILIILLIFIWFFGITFAWELEDKKQKAEEMYWAKQMTYQRLKVQTENLKNEKKILDKKNTDWSITEKEKERLNLVNLSLQYSSDTAIKNLKEQAGQAKLEFDKAKEAYDNSDESVNDFSSRGFKLNVNDVFPTSKYNMEDTMEKRTNIFFADIIQKLMIWLGSVALLLMTIGAWFMLIYHWEDNLLTKWKSIFGAGIISLVLALFSFYMIELVKYLIG